MGVRLLTLHLPGELIERFRAMSDAEPDLLVCTPGRVDLIGGHTNYNDGWVLLAAQALRSGENATLGNLVDESCISARDLFEASKPGARSDVASFSRPPGASERAFHWRGLGGLPDLSGRDRWGG